ncbi:DUF3000 domain-containing protein [Streptomyces sp. HNM0575]|uniref:DUF3000 domain-containing protein n=1 Tax=Streptomyces sp. HNM0575 TaxID=2716338 RepID=UPI00145D36A4|nr:DUF3000 domain-containing protein [Streptomyces sp. HNM0575]NLU74067.1 DUF3000 domain-containing protein [Streptomyces sp. HNM0575]
MAAARPRMTEGPGGPGGGGDGAPPPFKHAMAALNSAHTRPEVQLSALPAPKRLAPFSCALSASVVDPADESSELADGRFVLLHDPAGQESWQGTFRVVTLARTDLEPEIAGDPLLPEVTWSWLTGALEVHSAAYSDSSGTVTRSGSSYFGGLDERPPQTELEIRASWTPRPEDPAAPEALPDMAVHLTAWSELLCQCAGLPPEPGDGSSVVSLPKRRGPQPL